MSGKLRAVGGVTLKLEAVALGAKRQTEAKRAAGQGAAPVVMHVLICPEHMEGNVPVDASGAPVMLPTGLWEHLLFYPVADSERMLKILLHPKDARGAWLGRGMLLVF
jgi:hypothetical protein